jgi:hypothetical protein
MVQGINIQFYNLTYFSQNPGNEEKNIAKSQVFLGNVFYLRNSWKFCLNVFTNIQFSPEKMVRVLCFKDFHDLCDWRK